jgi:two-component system LytT family sensor kinase
MVTLAFGQDLLFTLLLKVGVAASLAALLVRWEIFRKVLFAEVRDSDLKVKLMLCLTPPLALGVALRLVGNPYRFADLMVEGAFLLGLLGGRVVGPLGGAMAAFAGLAGGLIREIIPTKEDIWDFGPFTFLNVPRWIKRMAKGSGPGWETLPLAGCVALELARQAAIHLTRPQWLFHLDVQNWWQGGLLVLATVMAVAVPIKIWNNTRIQMNLEQHQKLLLQARMAALSSQINPHFLFNTLNTVSSLIRYDPDQARIVVLKLGNILRRLLRKHETFVQLQDELAFVDDYLDIEVARFGRDNLQIVKEVDPQTLDAFVPSMLLQPIVENAIKHGLAARLDGGQITIRTSGTQGRLVIEVEDNGVGISQERMPQIFEGGIGISNVHERLRVLYAADFRMDVLSQEGQGTRIRIEVPELVTETSAAQ